MLIALLAMMLSISLAAPQLAVAGEYTIHTCADDEAGYSSAALEVFAERGMKWRRACNPAGPGLRGLVSANVSGPGRVPRGAESGFILTAPPETSFSRMRWSGSARRRDCRYALQLYAERPAGPLAIKNVRANRRCPKPGMAQASNYPLPRTYDLGGASRIIQRVVCVGAPAHDFCSARGQNYIGTLALEATVVDGVAPSVGIRQDSPFTRGEWVRGQQTFTYDASDNVGVKGASASIAGGQRGGNSRGCNFTQRIPCPSGPGLIDVDTAEIPEGSQALTVTAEDAAGNTATSGPVTVRLDNAAPGAVAVGVDGGEAWRNSNDFDLKWVNPPEPDRAPIVAAHFRLCRAGGNDCVSGDRPGAAVSGIDNLAVPGPGEWEVRMWREDAAHNQQAANASQPVRLRFDPEPPQLGFEGQNSEDPTRVSVSVTDRISGLDSGQIEISPSGSGTWQALQTNREGDHLVTRIDDASLPAGDYELRASARDQATNLGATNLRLDGQPARLTLPLRVSTSMKAGVIGKRLISRKGKKKKVRRTVLEARDKVPFGRRVRLGGRLVNASGHPLAGAKVQVYSQPAEDDEEGESSGSDQGAEKLEDTISTDSDGRFVYPVEARSSREFRFVYEGSATILPTEDDAELLVTATSTLTVKPNHVLNGESVWFSGRVRGRPLPEKGKLVELQWSYEPGEWQTFRTKKTEADGTWRIHYPFKNTCGTVVFNFRVFLQGEGGYPLEPGYSREVAVRVRGRPCP
ncbi:MAG TPA: hypothetical protein VFU11_04960 [Solirubrobacterales bacterium]|nr:hypothetical protein [Solirubrobacterales bacterium]